MAQKYDFILLISCAFIIHLTEKMDNMLSLHNMLRFQEVVKSISRVLCLLVHTVR